MPIPNLLDTEAASRDLTSTITVLTHTPSATLPVECRGEMLLGNGSGNDLDGLGGDFELTVTIDGVLLDSVVARTIAVGTTRIRFQTQKFIAPPNTAVVLRVRSPNAADTAVHVTARLWDVGAIPTAAEIAAAVPTLAAILAGITADHGAGPYTQAAGSGSGGSDPPEGIVQAWYKDMSPVTVEVPDVDELPDPDVTPLELVFETLDGEDVYKTASDDAMDASQVLTVTGNTFTFYPSADLMELHGQELAFALRVRETQQPQAWGSSRVEYLPAIDPPASP